ncbi:MAG: RsmB/NOP family class I SAM-dependent RNA methyltransferase [Streptococcaceae bacterium]|jgi:16S rRNA C967 or C1407 C5-methylase (RsmB/RsmF family)/NOL1/NOP2/fmu family ribosome biogenesis protein|nr:RsmB/NOP family class I SAM-dependent RNA methyltransferase [Streptococcaceae bacterium]
MKLPIEFTEKYKEILGENFPQFLESFDKAAISAFRVNPSKPTIISAEKLPESDFGYYGKISGKSKEFLSGELYSQEPAAQMVGEVAKVSLASSKQAKKHVLDLCAAPGGKTSHLLSYLNDEDILVSNEISAKRSKILVENLERWGSRNLVVLNESPEKLANTFKNYFDLIVIDAPCSGEGMFRKDPEAIQYWSQSYVEECASRQKEILSEAMKMLTAEGSIVYSTCTWSPEEDEEIVKWLLENYPDLELEYEKKFWPFEFSGEGQFVARFRNKATAKATKIKTAKSNLTAEQSKLWKDFQAKNLNVQFDGLLQVFGDNLFLVPKGLPDLSKLKIARNGLHLGIYKKNRFEPSYAFGMALSKSEAKFSVELTEEELLEYAKGNPISKNKDFPNAWTHLLIDGNGFGYAKMVDGTLKNNYPKGLRIR